MGTGSFCGSSRKMVAQWLAVLLGRTVICAGHPWPSGSSQPVRIASRLASMLQSEEKLPSIRDRNRYLIEVLHV